VPEPRATAEKTSANEPQASPTDAANADLKTVARPLVSTSDSPFSAVIEKQIAEAKERLRLRRDGANDLEDYASPFRKDGENKTGAGNDEEFGQAETEIFDVDPEPPVEEVTSGDEGDSDSKTVVAVGGDDSHDADSRDADSQNGDTPMAAAAAVTGTVDSEDEAQVEARTDPAIELDVIEARSPALIPEVLSEADESELAVLRQQLEERQRTGGELHTADEDFGGLFPRRSRLQARKVRRVVKHIDPWSVLTFSVVFHLCLFGALLISSVMVWWIADGAGTIEDMEAFITDLGDCERFEIDGNAIFRAAVSIAAFLTLASTALVVILASLFNLISDLVGGIRVTVIEEETVRIRTKPPGGA